MAIDINKTWIYHITDAANLPSIIQQGGLYSDVAIKNNGGPLSDIGYSHIKARRSTEIKVNCCDNRFVGEFVPFYYSPRSVMLFTVNRGLTGKPKGHQSEIIHLVSNVSTAIKVGNPWAISDGNAGSNSAIFNQNVEFLGDLNWEAINAKYWSEVTFEKQAEFLVANFYPFSSIMGIGCYNDEMTQRVQSMLNTTGRSLPVVTKPDWYY